MSKRAAGTVADQVASAMRLNVGAHTIVEPLRVDTGGDRRVGVEQSIERIFGRHDIAFEHQRMAGVRLQEPAHELIAAEAERLADAAREAGVMPTGRARWRESPRRRRDSQS